MSGGIGLLGGFFSPEGQGTGLLGGLHNTIQDNSGSLMGLGMGLMSGDMGAASQGYMQGQRQDFARRQQKALQDEALQKRTKAQDLAQRYGLPPEMAADPDAVFGVVKSLELQKRTPKELPSSYQEFQLAQNDPAYAAYRQKSGGGLGMSPIYGTRGGKTVAMQLSPDGRLVESAMPEGVELANGFEKLDRGTHWDIIDRRTGQTMRQEPKDIAGAAAQAEIGKTQGSAIAGASNQIDSATDTLNVLDQIENHPSRESATGFQANFPTRRGSDVASFEILVEQAKSGAFLTAIQQMRGLGALSEGEGRAATAAVNRMNIADSDEGFLKAVQDYKAIVERGKAKAEQLMRGRQQQAPQGGGTPGAIQVDGYTIRQR